MEWCLLYPIDLEVLDEVRVEAFGDGAGVGRVIELAYLLVSEGAFGYAHAYLYPSDFAGAFCGHDFGDFDSGLLQGDAVSLGDNAHGRNGAGG